MPNPKAGTVWGILGGTFDPVHYGHLTLARGMYEHRHLAGVLFVPSYRHPFKGGECRASFEDRVEMLCRAIDGVDYFTVSRIEKERDLSGRTLDTILEIKKRYPGIVFRFIIGADNLGRLQEWFEPEKLLAEVKMLVGVRPPFRLDSRLATGLPLGADIELVETEAVEVSSTEIREKLCQNRPDEELDRLIPSTVRQYIRTRKLYV